MSNIAHDAPLAFNQRKSRPKGAAQVKMLNSAIGLVFVAIHAALLRLAILIELTRLLATLLLLVAIGVARLGSLVLVAFVVHCIPHHIF